MPTTKTTEMHCELCDGIGHGADTCGTAEGGSATLIERAITKMGDLVGKQWGAQKKLADAIGISITNVSKLRAGVYTLSPLKRQLVVEFLRTGKLPAVAPERRSGRPLAPATSCDGAEQRRVFFAKRDHYAVLKIAGTHDRGIVGVIDDALTQWVTEYPALPKKIAIIEGDDNTGAPVGAVVLAAFDAAIGGTDRRPAWMPTAIARWVRRREFKATVGPIPADADLDAAIKLAAKEPRSVMYRGATRQVVVLNEALAVCIAMAARGKEITPTSLRAILEASQVSVNQILRSLVASEHLKRAQWGLYALTEPQPATDPEWTFKIARREAHAEAVAKREASKASAKRAERTAKK